MLWLLRSEYAGAQVELQSSPLPIIIINTCGQEIPDEPRIIANMQVLFKEDGGRNYITDPPEHYYGQISIEIRGSTSQSYPKKSYGLETQHTGGANRNVPLLGLPTENDWVLYAPYSDKSLIRNILSYQFARDLGQYAPRTKLCELVINGSYRGVYVLTEKIKRDNDRVDIAELEADDTDGDELTGGYIIKIDKQTGNSGNSWTTGNPGIYFQYEYPAWDVIASEQKEYIRDYLYRFEEALLSDDFSDPEYGFRSYLDEASVRDFFLINELCKNIDAYMLSTFLYKDKESKGGKLCMGPIWDFNLAFGNADYREGYRTEGFQLSINASPWWWDRLLMDKELTDSIRDKWGKARMDRLSDERINEVIDSLVNYLEEAQIRNFQQWDVLGNDIWPNYYIGESYSDEIDYLKSWVSNRIAWLDQKLINWNDIRESVIELSLHTYPNPFSENLTIEFFLEGRNSISLEVFDIQGRLLKRVIERANYPGGKHSISLETSDLPASIYFVVLSCNGKALGKTKIVKY